MLEKVKAFVKDNKEELEIVAVIAIVSFCSFRIGHLVGVAKGLTFFKHLDAKFFIKDGKVVRMVLNGIIYDIVS